MGLIDYVGESSIENDIISHSSVFICSYFQDGLKTIEHFGSYITDLSQGLQRIRQKQDEERKQLADLRQLLKSSHVFDKEVSLCVLTTTTGRVCVRNRCGFGRELHRVILMSFIILENTVKQ